VGAHGARHHAAPRAAGLTMAEPRMVDPHSVVMTGENSFVRLSTDGGKTLTERVSHWRVLWSPAGQGHAMYMQTRDERPRIYADNAGVARYLQRTIETLLHAPFADESLPVIDARFRRSGHSLATVEERIESKDDEIVLAWWDLMEPFILTMPPGAMNRPLGVYSTFIPARSAQLMHNGRAGTGKPFPQERFGKPSSSCCLAWSESWTRPQ
jgi:hypothetical protein